MHRSFLRGVLCTLALLLLAVPAAHAEAAHDTTGFAPAIVGRVEDTSGNALPNARVVITDLARATTTAADGSFSFRGLRAGTYHLDATLLGYAPTHAIVQLPESGPDVEVVIRMAPSPLALAGVHVTASPTGEDPLRVPQSTLQLTGNELGRNLRATVAQTLAEQPGISTRASGTAANAPVIRGLSGERILVLQDGQRTGDLSSTSPDHGVTVDPLAAQQLEVVRGPASLLYGNNALGGVVNVISNDIPTTVPPGVEGYFAAQAESGNPGGALSASVTLPVAEALALTVHGGGRRVSDLLVGGGETLENTFSRNAYGLAALGYARENISAGVAYRGYGFEYGLPFAPGAEEGGVRLDGFRHEAVGRADLILGSVGLIYLRLNGTAQWYQHDEVEPSGDIGTTFKLNTQTATLTGRTRLGRLGGAVGLATLFKQYTPEGEEALTPHANSSSFGAFLFQEFPFRQGSLEELRTPRLQFGARYDLYRVASEAGGQQFGPARTRDFQNISGSLGVTFPLASDVTLGASVARAFRAPTVEELFSNAFHVAVGTFDVGNPELEEETNLGADAVLRARTPGFQTQISAFYNRINNYITPNIVGTRRIEEGGAEIEVPLNIFSQDDAQLWGLEGQIEATLLGNWVVGAMGDRIRGEFIDGAPLPFMPAGRIGGSVRWDDSHYSAGVEVRHAFAQDRVPENELATDAYTLVGLNAGASLLRGGLVHSITLRVDNLLDELYRDASSRMKEFAPSPGRNLTLVYRVLF